MTPDRVAAWAARALEQGTFRGPVARRLSRAWELRADVVRDVILPRRARVVGVGGATLGGSYKTPLVLELALLLAARGARVAVVGHGYGARPYGARRVAAGDAVRDVGDEAVWLARRLSPLGVPVVVGGSRSSALALAACLAPLVVVDSLLQCRPERLALSILAVDASAPLGAGACPPAGDLRARPAALARAIDRIAVVGAPEGGASVLDAVAAGHQVDPVASRLAGFVDSEGRELGLDAASGLRVGLVTAVARPERIARSLYDHGIFPVTIREAPDHATPRERSRAPSAVDIWLTTPKCATKLAPTFEGRPLLTLDHRLALPEALVEAALGVPSP